MHHCVSNVPPTVVDDVVKVMRANQSDSGVARGIQHIRFFAGYQDRRLFVETHCPTPGGGHFEADPVAIGPDGVCTRRVSDLGNLCAALQDAGDDPARQFAILEGAAPGMRGLLLYFRTHLFSMIGSNCLCPLCLADEDQQLPLDMTTVRMISWWVATIDGLFSAGALAAGSPDTMPAAARTVCTAAGGQRVHEAMARERVTAVQWCTALGDPAADGAADRGNSDGAAVEERAAGGDDPSARLAYFA